MLVQYVDVCGISAPNRERITKFVSDLRALNFELTKERSFAEFLSIKFDNLPDESIQCTQKGLIEKTLEAAGMTDKLTKNKDRKTNSALIYNKRKKFTIDSGESVCQELGQFGEPILKIGNPNFTYGPIPANEGTPNPATTLWKLY